MVYKILTLILISVFNFSYSNIIYDKNNISITEIEVEGFIKLYKNSYDEELKVNQAIKNIILMKKTINFLQINNPNYISTLDENIKSKYNNFNFNNIIVLNYLRFQSIRNDFISDYFHNKFNVDQLELIFSSINDLILPISNNNCLTVDEMKNLNNDKYFFDSFYTNYKNGQRDFKTKINNEILNVCITEKKLKLLEEKIINYIINETEPKFKEFIYSKIIWKKK